MGCSRFLFAVALSGLFAAMGTLNGANRALAQTEQTAAASPSDATPAAPEPLSDDKLQVLVARIALYPDELVAVVAAASLYPLQVVEAERYLEDVKTNRNLKPKSDWDGSVVSLLNYPQIVKMMSDDLDWTQAFGDAIGSQQKDVLQAIQDLRDKAVADGIIKSDDKIKVTQENDNVVIQPASAETIYVPQYQPEMLYEENYVAAPINYWPDPYPSYYYPTAPYFAAFVTGAVWGAIVDWDDWGVWGGNGNGHWGNDIDIDCNHCFNNRDFNGKININDVDWKNVDRSKINFDKNQINKLDRTNIKNGLEQNNRNNIKNKAGDLKRDRPSTLPAKGGAGNDVRKSTLEGLKNKGSDKMAKPGKGPGDKMAKPGNKPGNKPSAGNRPASKPGGGNASRPSGKPKAGGKIDNRPKNSSPLGDINRGSKAKYDSNRGRQSMGGGMKSGGGMQKRYIPPRSGGFGGGGGRGGGGRGGGRR